MPATALPSSRDEIHLDSKTVSAGKMSSGCAPLVGLPPELLHPIVRYLPKKDAKSLRATSTCFVFACTQVIFVDVTLRPMRQSAVRSSNTLLEHRHIRHIPQHIAIRYDYEDFKAFEVQAHKRLKIVLEQERRKLHPNIPEAGRACYSVSEEVETAVYTALSRLPYLKAASLILPSVHEKKFSSNRTWKVFHGEAHRLFFAGLDQRALRLQDLPDAGPAMTMVTTLTICDSSPSCSTAELMRGYFAGEIRSANLLPNELRTQGVWTVNSKGVRTAEEEDTTTAAAPLAKSFHVPAGFRLRSLALYGQDFWGATPGRTTQPISQLDLPVLEHLALGCYVVAQDDQLNWILHFGSLRSITLDQCAILAYLYTDEPYLDSYHRRRPFWRSLTVQVPANTYDRPVSFFAYDTRWSHFFDILAGLPLLQDFRFDHDDTFTSATMDIDTGRPANCSPGSVKSLGDCLDTKDAHAVDVRLRPARYVAWGWIGRWKLWHMPDHDGILRWKAEEWHIEEHAPTDIHERALEDDRASLDRLLALMHSRKVSRTG